MTVQHQVSVAILSWNGRRHLETCLEALSLQHDPGVAWEVLVLDNGSTDGTGAWLRARYPEGRLAPPPASPRLRVIESPVNLGFCAGVRRRGIPQQRHPARPGLAGGAGAGAGRRAA
jgi:GT2 family glycosyltransferase